MQFECKEYITKMEQNKSGVGGRSQGVGGRSQGVGGRSHGVGGQSQGVGGRSQGVGGLSEGVGGSVSGSRGSVPRSRARSIQSTWKLFIFRKNDFLFCKIHPFNLAGMTGVKHYIEYFAASCRMSPCVFNINRFAYLPIAS